MIYEDRIEATMSALPVQRTNCTGTALYVLGLIDGDRRVDSKALSEILEESEVIGTPDNGALTVSTTKVISRPAEIIGSLVHVGVIVQREKLSVFHRIDLERFPEFTSLDAYLLKRSSRLNSTAYFMPKQV